MFGVKIGGEKVQGKDIIKNGNKTTEVIIATNTYFVLLMCHILFDF